MTPGTDWIDQAQRLIETLRGGPADATSATGAASGDGHSSDCRWCPLCTAAAVVRGERPEVTAALADLLTTAATALRTVAATGDPQRATTADEPEVPQSEPPSVQRIDIA